MANRRTSRQDDATRVMHAFRCIFKSLRLADRAGVRDYGLGAAQLFVLHELNDAAPLSVRDLAERTATDQSTVSVVVSKLIDKGYVAGARSEQDARRLELRLTPKGRQAVNRMPPPVQHAIIEAVRRLPRTRAKELADTLMEIVEAMGIEDVHPPMFFDEAEAGAKKRR